MSEQKRRGRPALDPSDTSVPVSLSLPSRTFDEISRQAMRENVSVPEIIRRKLRQADEADDDD